MNYSKKHICLPVLFSLLLGIAVLGIASCSKMDATYKDFWKDGEHTYPAIPDSLKVYPGKNRIEITWLILGDPTVSKAKIFWNNRADSTEIPIERSSSSNVDTVRAMLDNMPEGTYTFDIYTYDDEGNQSISKTVTGKVYGDGYISSLLTRLISKPVFLNDSLTIVWGDPADETSIGVEIVYTDVSGAERHLEVPADADTTVVTDYDFNADKSFAYRTVYLPDSMSIDTFYTAYSTVKVKDIGSPPIDFPKTGWTITASSFDSRSGASYRPPQNTIDENPSTIWVNQISPQTDYPHWLMVDMGSVQDGIEGLSLLVQNRNETPKTIEILISDDDIAWTSMGTFSVQNTKDWQYLDFFPEAQHLRYFRVNAIEPSGNTPNIVIAEVGVFKR